jgi:hypothetical protein
MILRLCVRSLMSRPLRSAVLAGGFGLGVAVMAALLGIGGVMLDQARAPALVGGGDVIVGSSAGRITARSSCWPTYWGAACSPVASPLHHRARALVCI